MSGPLNVVDGPLVVVNGATLMCTKCPTPSHLSSTTGVAVQLNAEHESVASIYDNVGGVNIIPFATCITKGKCKPETSSPWSISPISSVLYIADSPMLVQGSQLQCTYGKGTITITNAGQSTTTAAEAMEPYLSAVLGERIAELAMEALIGQPSKYQGIPCNVFVADIYRAAGLDFPQVHESDYNIPVIVLGEALGIYSTPLRDPLSQELANPQMFDGNFTYYTIGQAANSAKVGDIVVWASGSHNHSAILTDRSGPDPWYWKVVYAPNDASQGNVHVKTGTIHYVTYAPTGEGGTVPVFRGLR